MNPVPREAQAPPFLRDHWYVAAWADEVTRTPLGRVVLGDGVVLYRAEDGSVVALADRCPHRNLPLSAGRLAGDSIECGYHGMVFDRRGQCTHLPGAEAPPAWARVASYPAIERNGWVMLWMGSPDRADPARAPDFHKRLADPDWLTLSGHIEVGCGYRLILDNLLDLSHLAFVHASSTGNRALAETARITCETTAERVRVTRRLARIPPARAFADYGGYAGDIDRWQVSEFTPPAYIYVNSGTAPADSAIGPERHYESQGDWGFVVYHAITPRDARTSHQFWSLSIPHAFVPADRRDVFEAQMRIIPLEDVAVYEAQQRAIDLDPAAAGDVRPAGMIDADEGLYAMRRILRRLATAEAADRAHPKGR